MMKNILITLFLTPKLFLVKAQEKDVWSAFRNKDNTLVGYKDSRGMVRIKPKFNGYFAAQRFEHIMVVSQTIRQKWVSYHLTKSGRVVGRDSTISFDNSPDCENEGFIRFKVPKSDLVGMFNKDGNVKIPAEYNALSRSVNGMIMALKGAKKVGDDEHYFFDGGHTMLIDTTNQVLIENFSSENNLNFYSLEKSASPSTNPIRKSFLAKDGQYYSFIDFEKEFKHWLINEFLIDLTIDKLQKNTFHTSAVKRLPTQLSKITQRKIQQKYQYFKAELQLLLKTETEYQIFVDALSRLGYSNKAFDKYFDNCGNGKAWLYPTMEVVFTHHEKGVISQNFIKFLKTDIGYQLLMSSDWD